MPTTPTVPTHSRIFRLKHLYPSELAPIKLSRFSYTTKSIVNIATIEFLLFISVLVLQLLCSYSYVYYIFYCIKSVEGLNLLPRLSGGLIRSFKVNGCYISVCNGCHARNRTVKIEVLYFCILV